MRTLVTGGTGFLGCRLVGKLLEKGHDVSVLYRSEEKRARLPEGVKGVRGDVLEPDSLAGCCEGMDTVFHVAGEVAWGRRLRSRMMEVNVHGTKHIVAEALRAGVKRFVHTSSAAAVGFSPDAVTVDETFPFNGDALNNGYAIAKRRGEEEALRAVEKGLSVVVVNPAVILGPGSPSFVRMVAEGKLSVAPAGGISLCGVEDVVRGHILAAEKGRSGERYILGGTNWEMREAFQQIAEVAGTPRSIHRMGRMLALGAAALAEIQGWVAGRDAAFAWDLGRLTGWYAWYSSEKAERELGYRCTPLETILHPLVGPENIIRSSG
ncbi:NAD-dependent epimerase/dehydratase family protein [Salinithrix halophila]|uniref:NAD-dependent epimerase/dehydratase family protein n=1 Tax=Salinithrix halophila TaxID=1485204 RepID=A0ABV8JGX3_9BACL